MEERARFPPPAAYRDGGQQPLRHVGYDDADEKDDGLKPGVLKDQRKDEEGHTQEHGHTRDDMDEMLNFCSDGSLASFQPRSKCGNSSHHRAVPSVHDNATRGALKKGGRGNRTTSHQRSHRFCTTTRHG